MTDRESWLGSRHLRESAAGAEALALLDTLGRQPREAILQQGDRLASVSVTLAHRYLVAAAAAHRLPGDAPSRWQHLATTLAASDPTDRELLGAFFAIDPGVFAGLDGPLLDRWIAMVRRLHARNRRLSARWLEITAAALGNSPASAVALLEAWFAAVDDTLATSDWRGELLAGVLVDSIERAFALLDPVAVTYWARLVRMSASAGRAGKTPVLPACMERLEAVERTRVLAAVVDAAECNPAIGLRLLDALPRALAPLPTPARYALLSALTHVTERSDLADTLALLPGVTHAMRDPELTALFDELDGIASAFPAGLAPYLRTLDRALEQGGLEGVKLWVARGLEIGRTNERAGVSYFRLESRTSHKVLVQHTAAVPFEEVEALMQRLLRMLSRRSFQLVAAPGIWLRPPLSAPEDTLVRLPERVDLHDTSEENQSFYKLTVAHLAGRWEYGTYDFDLQRLIDRGLVGPDPERESNDIIGFLDSFPNPLLAAALFVLLDGARIDAALERDFAGLASDMKRLGRHYAAHPPPAAADRPAEALLEALFLLSVGGAATGELPPRLAPMARLAQTTLQRLRRPDATVYDSAEALLGLYGRLALAHVRPEAESEDTGFFTDVGGATVIDPLEHLDAEGAPPTGAAAGSPAGGQDDLDADLSEQEMRLALDGDDAERPGAGRPLTPEELRALLESGADLRISEAHGADQASLGLYITDLLGKLPAGLVEELRERLAQGDLSAVQAWLVQRAESAAHTYDEWDYRIGDYRRGWCRLTEREISGDGGEYFHNALASAGDLVQRLKHEFQMMKPEQYRKVRGMEHGEEFDLSAVVDAHADRRSRRPMNERLYVARRREERDIATLFLVDMSASTDEPLQEARDGSPRRVIDLTKDTLAVLSEVIDGIGDAYAIYGFSGHGRDNVEFYHVKSFSESLSAKVKSRLGGIQPKRSTRMGAALRHSGAKMTRISARSKYLILLSDGFPQDFDYGDDRRSNVYGIQDTTRALQELERQGVRTFCITVDPAGHDYLRTMCPESRYAVIDDIASLPEELPRIYRSVTRG